MSPVCFVTERLFPFESIDDWAIELSWRAQEIARCGSPVVVFWMTLADLPPARVEQARGHYAAMGVDLVVKEDVAPFVERDEPLHRSAGSGMAGLLVLPALRKLHEQRRFQRIEIAAERGFAFRVVQAQRAGLAFTDTELVVVLGNFGEWKRHQQRRLAVRPEEIKQDFMERETVELAESVFTTQPEKILFAEELGWEPGRILARGLTPPAAPEVREIGVRSLPCSLGDPDEDAGFENFRAIIEGTNVFPRWLHLEESRSNRATLRRRQALETATKNSRSQVEFLANPDWETLPALLREKEAFVILHSGIVGARLHWLVRESIPFVFPENLLGLLPDHQRPEFARLAFANHDRRALFRALQNACTFADWPRLLLAWRESLRLPEPTARQPAPHAGAAVPRPPVSAPDLPRVTIAVSHYNLKQLLAETLVCLEAQTYPACDVVVVDDGSDDPESLRAWQACQERFPAFSFIVLPHRGYWSPRNHAIEQCANPFIIIVDGDNLPRPDMAEIFVRAMQRNPQFAAFTSYIAAFSEDRQAALRGEFQALNAPLGGDIVSGYFQNTFGDTNSIFRTGAIQAIHGFRENFQCAFGDWELFHRLVGQGHRLGVIPRVLLHYRRRAGGMIRQRSLYREHWEFFETLEAPADLRRADRRRLNFALHGLALNP